MFSSVATKKLDETPEELLRLGITELRMQLNSDASEIIVPFKVELPEENVNQTVPMAGDKKKLIDLALKNALYVREEKEAEKQKIDDKNLNVRILDKIKEDFRLKERPLHIECFDNSNIQGTTPVASMVVFKNAKPSKKDYRHFNIKTVEGPDDFLSMKEIVFRRYKKLTDEAQALPQLIVIDGGKGQLNAACESLKEIGIYGQVAICSIAKKLEEIYFPEDPLPLYISKNSESLKIIQQLRNEAHRFAIIFHRQKRSKAAINSELTEIKGIGDASLKELMKKFRSIKNLKAATEREIAEIVGKSKARIIMNYFAEKSGVAVVPAAEQN